MQNREVRVLIAASGTGGHLFPAVDIAKALVRRPEPVRVEFIGAGRPLEAAIVDAAGFTRHVIKTVGIKQRGLRGALEFSLTLPGALRRLWRLFSSFRPDAVVGVGGYVSVLPVTMARLRGVPTWIHEAERRPGMANALLARYADKISIAFEDAEVPCRHKAVYTGQPIREIFREIAAERHEVERPRRVLITGGSQGARALDEALLALTDVLRECGVLVRHQCRTENVEKVRAGYRAAGIEAQVEDFIADLPDAYRWCDLVIARAGAATVMELGVVNRPAILVPFPYAQGNHQLRNAEILADAGKAVIVEEGEGFRERLGAALRELQDSSRYCAMRDRPYRSRSLDAAQAIATGCMALVRRGGGRG